MDLHICICSHLRNIPMRHLHNCDVCDYEEVVKSLCSKLEFVVCSALNLIE